MDEEDALYVSSGDEYSDDRRPQFTWRDFSCHADPQMAFLLNEDIKLMPDDDAEVVSLESGSVQREYFKITTCLDYLCFVSKEDTPTFNLLLAEEEESRIWRFTMETNR